MSQFINEIENIYRLKIPFDTVYTSVFFIKSESKNFLVDCATTADDVNRHILPALAALGYSLSDVTAIVLTHNHGDHAGGLPHILELNPDIKVVTDARTITKDLSAYPLPGHTLDSIGVFDSRTNTLISGDGLQGAGVDKYRCSLQNKNAYLETLRKIEADGNIENVLFSHAYEPWNKDTAFGRDNVKARIKDCYDCVK